MWAQLEVKKTTTTTTHTHTQNKTKQNKTKNHTQVDIFPLRTLQLSSISSYPSGRVKDSHIVSPWHFSGEGSHLPLWCSLTNVNTSMFDSSKSLLSSRLILAKLSVDQLHGL